MSKKICIQYSSRTTRTLTAPTTNCWFSFADFTSGAEVWIGDYEDPTFERQMEDTFYRVRPLFEELHAFVRHALSVKYGENLVPNGEPIPMHLLGNIWAQHWAHVSDSFGSKFNVPQSIN